MRAFCALIRAPARYRCAAGKTPDGPVARLLTSAARSMPKSDGCNAKMPKCASCWPTSGLTVGQSTAAGRRPQPFSLHRPPKLPRDNPAEKVAPRFDARGKESQHRANIRSDRDDGRRRRDLASVGRDDGQSEIRSAAPDLKLQFRFARLGPVLPLIRVMAARSDSRPSWASRWRGVSCTGRVNNGAALAE